MADRLSERLATWTCVGQTSIEDFLPDAKKRRQPEPPAPPER